MFQQLRIIETVTETEPRAQGPKREPWVLCLRTFEIMDDPEQGEADALLNPSDASSSGSEGEDDEGMDIEDPEYQALSSDCVAKTLQLWSQEVQLSLSSEAWNQ